MNSNCIVLDVFNTTQLGEVAIIAFPESKIPKMKMVLENKFNLKWEIVGITANRSNEPLKKYSGYKAQSIWACALKTLSHSNAVNKNDILHIVND